MNWLKKGPELKLPKLRKPSLKAPGLKRPSMKSPELKPPEFLADLYYDLRDRRLLPLVALVLVAIAAVPFLLGGDAEEPLPPVAVGAAAPGGGTARASNLTVVEATPGLRDYRKRLDGRSPTDPFVQQFTTPPSSGSSSGGEGSSSSSGGADEVITESSAEVIDVEADGGSPIGSGGGSGGGGQDQGARLIEFVFDLQISHSEETPNGQRMSEPEVRRRVPTLTQLPSRKTPAVTVAGINLHNGKVWFLVSDEVGSLDGDFGCVTRTPAGLCELLEIEAGFPLELTYGPDQVLYRIKVTKVDAVWAGKVGDGASSTRAAFGGPAATALPTGGGGSVRDQR